MQLSIIEETNAWTSHTCMVERKKKCQNQFKIFSQAFESVPQERLLLKASYYGIRGKLHTWLRNFLKDRKQRVVVNET